MTEATDRAAGTDASGGPLSASDSARPVRPSSSAVATWRAAYRAAGARAAWLSAATAWTRGFGGYRSKLVMPPWDARLQEVLDASGAIASGAGAPSPPNRHHRSAATDEARRAPGRPAPPSATQPQPWRRRAAPDAAVTPSCGPGTGLDADGAGWPRGAAARAASRLMSRLTSVSPGSGRSALRGPAGSAMGPGAASGDSDAAVEAATASSRPAAAPEPLVIDPTGLTAAIRGQFAEPVRRPEPGVGAVDLVALAHPGRLPAPPRVPPRDAGARHRPDPCPQHPPGAERLAPHERVTPSCGPMQSASARVGLPDAGPPRVGLPDAGPPRAGLPDAGPPRAGLPDAGPPRAEPRRLEHWLDAASSRWPTGHTGESAPAAVTRPGADIAGMAELLAYRAPEGGGTEDLADQLDRVLRDEARRHGIDV
jgi:hypothetical protein